MGRLVKQPHGGAIYLADKGETQNPNGRPKKLRTILKREGYQLQDIHETIELLLSMDVQQLGEVFKDPKASILEKTIAKALAKSLEKGSLYSIETLLSRRFGKPKETAEVQTEMAVVHRIKLG